MEPLVRVPVYNLKSQAPLLSLEQGNEGQEDCPAFPNRKETGYLLKEYMKA